MNKPDPDIKKIAKVMADVLSENKKEVLHRTDLMSFLGRSLVENSYTPMNTGIQRLRKNYLKNLQSCHKHLRIDISDYPDNIFSWMMDHAHDVRWLCNKNFGYSTISFKIA